MRRVARPAAAVLAATATALALLTAGALPSQAATGRAATGRPVAPASSGSLPRGWHLTSTRHGVVLSWRSPTPLHLTDAGVSFALGQRPLGTARLANDGRTLTLPLDSLPAGNLSQLSAWQGTQRLDRSPLLPRSVAGNWFGRGQSVPQWQAHTQLLSDDPGVRGPYAITSRTYSLRDLPIPGLDAPVEMLGRIVRPVNTTTASPLVLFLHGRHSTCYKGHRSSGDWPCRTGWSPIPSYLGYLQTQRLLASQGYVTVSISANGINGQDWALEDGGAEARSLLVRTHLRDFARWSNHGGWPFGNHLLGKIDMSHVVLIGHSRGGEGVNRAAIDSHQSDPWHIAGQVLIGPTDFGQEVASAVPTEVILPYCDGDVSDLQGQQFVDRARDISGNDTAFRSAVMVMGADHNFFNREWTPGVAQAPSWDDWGDSRDAVCGTSSPTRLTAAQQRDVGAVYESAGVHLFASDDTGVLPLLDGSQARVASAGDALVHSEALGGNRVAAYLPTASATTSATGGVASDLCRGFAPRSRHTCASHLSVPHFLTMWWSFHDPAPRAWRVGWSRPRGSATVPTTGADLSASTHLELRVAADPRQPPAKFAVRVTDADGHSFTWPTSTVTPLPGGRFTAKVWAQAVRVRLAAAAAAGVDTSRITSLSVLPRSTSGRIWVLDAHGWSTGLAPVPALRLPQLDAGRTTVVEGNGGPHTEYIHIAVSRAPITTPVSFWYEVQGGSYLDPIRRDKIVTLAPGSTGYDIPIQVSGDTNDDDDYYYGVLVKALHGVSVGDYLGSMTVQDDDPTPTITASDPATAVEGSRLTWTLTLSQPSDVMINLGFRFRPPVGQPELTTADVPGRWLRHCGRVPAQPVPLSKARLWCANAEFEPGATTATISIPTLADAVTEGTEYVRLRQSWSSFEPVSPKLVLHGEVTDS
jgi:hypothetical protein